LLGIIAFSKETTTEVICALLDYNLKKHVTFRVRSNIFILAEKDYEVPQAKARVLQCCYRGTDFPVRDSTGWKTRSPLFAAKFQVSSFKFPHSTPAYFFVFLVKSV
jgi:hypothetical protein